jgi:hypothetical protein
VDRRVHVLVKVEGGEDDDARVRLTSGEQAARRLQPIHSVLLSLIAT